MVNGLVKDVLIAVSDGNPGALSLCLELLTTKEGFVTMLQCGKGGLVGTKLYVVWNDYCERDTNEFIKLIQDKDVQHALSLAGKGRGGL